MTRPEETHLDWEEVGALVSSSDSTSGGSTPTSARTLDEIRSHADACSDCNRKVLMHMSVQRQMTDLKGSNEDSATPSCVEFGDCLCAVAGLLAENRTRELMKHSAECGYCGPLLSLAGSTLEEEISPEEEAVLADLKSALPAWKRRMSQRLSARSKAQKAESTFFVWLSRFVRWPMLAAPAFILLCFVLAATWLILKRNRQPSPDQLLAQAYSERRNIEIRIPGAKYVPMRIERGSAEESDVEKPEALLKLEALIGEHLKKDPNDVSWLDAKASADILDWKYDSAIKTSEKALGLSPDSAELLEALGSAYLLRGETSDHAADFGDAIESFSRALNLRPEDPVFLFNRALADEQMFLYTQAVQDWEHYLRVDPDSGWAGEARKHLDQVQEKIRNHEHGENIPLPEPIQLTKMGNRPAQAAIDGRMEDFLKISVDDWLPRAFPLSREETPDALVVRSALRLVARTSVQMHKDSWLHDLMAESFRTDFPEAVRDLADADRDNDRAATAFAAKSATEAASLLGHYQSSAGLIRAKLELIFASNTAQNRATCFQAASALSRSIATVPYPWIRAQFYLESGTCAWLREDIGTTKRSYSLAEHEAESSDYKQLQMRAQDHLAGLDAASGDFPAAWSATRRGLEAFWSGKFPNVRGYNFYFCIYEVTRLTGLHQTQVAAWWDGLRLVGNSPDIGQQAIAHSAMGIAAEAAGLFPLSKTEFMRASNLLSFAPKDASTRAAGLEAETRLAGVEEELGDANSAAKRLRPLEVCFRTLPDSSLAILFYTNLGRAESTLGNSADAEKALKAALFYSDQQLRSLRDYKPRIQIVEQTGVAYRTLIERYLALGHSQAALLLWERYRAAPALADIGPGRLLKVSFSPVQSATLAPYIAKLDNETVISYAFLPGSLAIWVVDDQGVSTHWITGQNKEIKKSARAIRSLCSQPGSNSRELRRQSHLLYDLIISPVESHLKMGRQLAIESDDELEGVPFEVLTDDDGAYLGDRVAMVSSQGLFYRNKIRPRVPFSQNIVALIAAVPRSQAISAEHAAPLPEVIDEAEDIAHDFRNTVLLESTEATSRALLSHLPQAALLHFAGHSINTPDRVGILMFDSILSPDELAHTHLSPLQLVVLSACDTQDGPNGTFKSADSLVRIFLHAGVPAVVASRWKVDSVVTRHFMDRFYHYLLGGDSVADSLRRAQFDLRSQPDTADPYFWSAFGVFGRG